MSTTTKKLSAGLAGLLLGAAALVSSGPAMAGFKHGGFRHGGFGHHHKWHHRGWGYGYGYHAPVYYGGCRYKRFVTYYGDIVFKKVCY